MLSEVCYRHYYAFVKSKKIILLSVVKFILWCSLLLKIVVANAQTGQVLNLTLPQAVEMTKNNYPSIKAREALKKASEKGLQSTRSLYLPAVILQSQANYATANSVTGTFFPNEGFAMPTSSSVNGYKLGSNTTQGALGNFQTLVVNWTVFAFGKIRSQVTLSKAEVQESNTEYANEIFQQQVKVSDAYLLLLRNQKLSLVQRENYNRAIVLRTAIRAAAISGMRPGVDTAFADAEVSRTKILLLESIRQVKASSIMLSELIGSVSDSVIIDSMSFYSNLPLVEPDSAIDINNHPLLKMYLSRIEVGNKRSNAVMKSYFPSIKLMAAGIGRGTAISPSAGGTYDYIQKDGLQITNYNYFMGITMLWNMLDYPRIRNEFKSAEYITQSYKYNYDEEKLKITREIENSELQLALSREQAKEAPIQLTAAKSAFEQASARYRNGLSTLPELEQNFYILNRAEVDLTVATNNVWRSLLVKSAAVGDLSIFMNQVK